MSLPPKAAQVADHVRGLIAGGTLKPGDITPPAPALRDATGACVTYCYRALRELVRDGVLVAGPSRQARPRVAEPQAPGAGAGSAP